MEIAGNLQQNLLQIGKTATQDFGRFNGVVSLSAFISLYLLAHFTLRPARYQGAPSFVGALILSLIVGFGYGALRFRPLLKLFADAMRERPETG